MSRSSRDLAAARAFFVQALKLGTAPVEVTTDRAASYPRVLGEFLPQALHTVEQYANNPIERQITVGSKPDCGRCAA
jgi:IS6 family transposase